MMRSLLAAAIACVGFSTASAEARQSVADCESVWKTVLETIGTSLPIESPGRMSVSGDECVLRDLKLEQANDIGMRFRATAIRFKGEGLDSLAQGLPPTSLSLVLEDFRMSPKTGDAGYDYLLMKQQGRENGVDLVLRAHWAEADKMLLLDQLDVDFPGDNALKLTGKITGIDLSSRERMELSAGGMALTDLNAEIVSNGLFEHYLLMPLGSTLLYGAENPEELVETRRATAIAGLKDVPETILPPASRQALEHLLGELPNPAGKLALRMQADPGIGPATLTRAAVFGVPQTVAETASYLQGAVFDITYTPTVAE